MLESRQTAVVVVGQTPPPHHGQAVMIEALMAGRFENSGLRLHLVRMSFSRTMEEVGRWSPRKLVELVRLVARIHRVRRRTGARIIYYPPAGPFLVPMLRDLVVLPLVRPFFERTVLHFHAGGLGRFIDSLPRVLRPPFRLAYGRPNVAVRVSRLAPDDGAALGAGRCVVVPNGVADHAASRIARCKTGGPTSLLFVGRLGRRKGTDTLVKACGRLRERGVKFLLRLVGSFESEAEARYVQELITRCGVGAEIELSGVLTGEEKWLAFESADVFCYPSRHETETFGIAAVEAMSFGLPVVATRWRGLAEIVEDGETGFLVPTEDDVALAERIELLIASTELRNRMGRAGRNRYEERYSIDRFHARFEAVFVELAAELGS